MSLLKNVLNFFLSLRTAVWLLLFLLLVLLYGSFVMPLAQEFSSLNSMPLFGWLKLNSLSITWWLYLSIVLLSLLTANTIICSLESVLKKRSRSQWLLFISPQLMHAGFLFILLAHLLSSAGSFRINGIAYEGSLLDMPDNVILKVEDVSYDSGPAGHISDWTVHIEYLSEGRAIKRDMIRPNSPSFYNGYGVYVKNIQGYPLKAVLLELSREPGAAWALAGGLFFAAGIVTFLLLKIKKESS